MAQAFLSKIENREPKPGFKVTDFHFSNGDRVGAGKYPPKFAKEGNYYEYEIEMNGNFKNLKAGSMKELAKPAGVSPAATAPVKSFGKSPETQDTISRQAAANTAIAFVKLLVDADALPVPKAAKSDKKADLIEEVTKMYMQKFHNWSVHKDFDFNEADADDPLDLKSLEAQEDWNE